MFIKQVDAESASFDENGVLPSFQAVVGSENKLVSAAYLRFVFLFIQMEPIP